LKERLRSGLDWGSLVPLRLRAEAVADGIWAGTHRSARKGAGVEFGGHRNYVPGDDLRWLDRHALMRHGRLMVREFETETDRTLWLLVDASTSMAFKSRAAPGAKLAYAALIASALSKVALAGGDPVGLEWLWGNGCRPQPAVGGRDAFERLLATLEEADAGGSTQAGGLDSALARIARQASRGAVIVFLSDLLDLPEHAPDAVSALSNRERKVITLRVLDPVEAEFPFSEPVRLKSAESDFVVETDGETARQGYLEALEGIAQRWHETLVMRNGRLLRATTRDDPVGVVRKVLQVVSGRTS
jgi:uncharacterized protein (DUF58 family)